MIITTAGNDIFDIGTDFANQTTTLLLVAVAVIAIIYVLGNAIQHKMSVSRVIVALLAAGLLVWGVNNIGFLQQTTEDTLEEGAPRSSSEAVPAPAVRT